MVSGAATYFTGRLQRRDAEALRRRHRRTLHPLLWAERVSRQPDRALRADRAVHRRQHGVRRAGELRRSSPVWPGVLPKTAIIAFAGDGIMDALGKSRFRRAMGVIAIALWIVVAVVVRKWLRPQIPQAIRKGATTRARRARLRA